MGEGRYPSLNPLAALNSQIGRWNRSASDGATGRMKHLHETVHRLVSLAASYRVGTINEAEQVVDAYLIAFQGYRARKAAMDALLNELDAPIHRACNRGGLFEQVERHLERRHRLMAREFQ